MATNNNQQDPTFGVKGVQLTSGFKGNQGEDLMNVDFLDASISSKQPMENMVNGIRKNDEVIINPLEYYEKKYSDKYNPDNPDAIKHSDLIVQYNKAKVLAGNYYALRQQDLTYSELGHAQELYDIQRRNPKIRMGKEWNMGDTSNITKSFVGTYDPMTGLNDSWGSEEEIAAGASKMRKFNPKTKEFDYVDMVDDDMKDKLYTDKGDMIVTYPDENNYNQPTLTILPADSYAPNESQYSTKFGPRKDYGSGFHDFFASIYTGAVAKTMQSFSSIGSMVNDGLRYNENYIFERPKAEFDAYVSQLDAELLKNNNIKASQELHKALNEGSFEDIINAMNYAEASLPDLSLGNSFKQQRMPLDWTKHDKYWQRQNNYWQADSFKMSNNIANGKGFINFAINQGEMIGYLLPQILIGVATQGAGTAANSAAWLAKLGIASDVAKGIGYAGAVLANTVGTTQAFQSYYRTGIEAGINRDSLAAGALWVLPATYATEAALNKWLFKTMDDNTLAQVQKEVFKPAFERLAKMYPKGTKVPLKDIKNSVLDMFGDLYKNKGFKTWIGSGSYAADIVKANASEVLQENTEQLWYNAVQMNMDSNTPDYYEANKGKFGTSSLVQQWEETTMGTIFATTLMSAITGAVPRMIRKAKGESINTKQDKERQNYIAKKTLEGKSGELLDMADSEWRDKNGGVYGDRNWKLKDATIGEDPNASTYTVPKSARLQANGLEEGSLITDIATMKYVQHVEQIEAYDELIKGMNLSELDRTILANQDFNANISLTKSSDAYIAQMEAKRALESFQSDPSKTEDENNIAKQKLVENYNQAKAGFDYYAVQEEGTGHSKAINDIVKTNTALVNQVAERIKIKEGFEDLTVEQKNDKNFINKYTDAWKNVIKENYTYDRLQKLHEEVKLKNANAIANREKTIETIGTNSQFTSMQSSLDELTQKFEKSIAGNNNDELKGLLSEFTDFSKAYGLEMSSSESLISMDDLNSLKGKYKGLYQQAQNAISVLRPSEEIQYRQMAEQEINTEFETKISEAQQKENDFAAMSGSTQQRIDEIDEYLTSETITEEERLAAETEKANVIAIQKKSEEDESSYNKVGVTSQTLKEQHAQEVERVRNGKLTEDEGITNQDILNEYSDSNLSGQNMIVSHNEDTNLPEIYSTDPSTPDLVYGYRQETKEQFDKRLQTTKDKLVDESNRTFLENFFLGLNKDMEEALFFIQSIIDNSDEYLTKYPDGNYKDANWVNVMNEKLQYLEKIESLKNAFEVARALHGRENFNRHTTTDEKAFVSELAKLNEEDKNELESLFDNAIHIASEVKRLKGDAELANSKKQLHVQTVINQNKYNSVLALLSSGLVNEDGTPLIEQALVDAFNEVGNISKDIINANGQYTNEQAAEIANHKIATDNVLSALQAKKDVLLNETNIGKFFLPFTQLFQDRNSSEGQIFRGDDSASHIGDSAGQTNRTRQLFLEFPLFSLVEGKPVWSFQQKTEKNEAGEDESFMVPQHIIMTQLREHLNVLMSINSKFSVNQINTLRKEDFEADEMIETGEQEQVVNSAISFLSTNNSNNTLELLWKHMDGDNTYKVNNPLKVEITNYFTNALTIGGDFGVGKTQFVLDRALKYLMRLEANDQNKSIKKLVFVSITDKLKQLHEATFKQDGATHISLKKDMIDGIKNIAVTSDMIYVIDEASIISAKEFELIRDHFHNKGAKVVFLGDTFQMRDRSASSRTPDVMFRTMTTHLMTQQFSSNSPLLNSLANATRKTIANGNNAIEFGNVSQDITGDIKRGAYFFANRMEVWQSFMDGIDKHTERAIIFADETQYKKFIDDNANLKEQIEKQFEQGRIYYAFRETNGSTEQLIQGLREKEVYIAFSDKETGIILGNENSLSSSLMASALYTSIGRASKWVGMIGNTRLNKSVSETESIGSEIDNSVFNDIMRDKMRSLYKIYFDKVNTTQTAGGTSTKVYTGSIVTSNDIGGYDTHKYSYEVSEKDANNTNVVIKLNDQEFAEVIGSENDEDAIKQFVIGFIKDELGKEVTEQETIIPTEDDKVVVGEFEVNVDDDIVVDGIEATVTGANQSTETITIITSNNEVKTVSVNEPTLKKRIENKDDTDKRSDFDRTQKVSSSKFVSNQLKHSIVWATSASSIDKTVDETPRQRLLNNILVANPSGLTFKVIKKTKGTMIDENNNQVAIVNPILTVQAIMDTTDESLRQKLDDKFKGTSLNGEWISYGHLSLQDAINKIFGIKGNAVIVGTISEPRIPTMDIKREEYINASHLTTDEIAKAWDDYITLYENTHPTETSSSSNLHDQKAYNIELRNLRDITEVAVKVTPTVRRVNYTNKVHTPLTELLKDIPNAKVDAAPVYNSVTHRLTVNVTINGKERLPIIVTMPLLKNNDKAVKSIVELLNTKESLNAISGITGLKQTGAVQEINKVFVNTPLYQLLKSNASLILKGNDALSKELKGLFDFKQDKKNGKIRIFFRMSYDNDMQIKNDSQDIYSKAIKLVNAKLLNSPYYDFLQKDVNGFKTHDGSSILSQLMVYADRISNVQMDVIINKKQEVKPSTNIDNLNETISDDEYNMFVDNDIVSQSTIENIASKIIKHEKLSDRETSIFNGKTKQINSIIKLIYDAEQKAKEKPVVPKPATNSSKKKRLTNDNIDEGVFEDVTISNPNTVSVSDAIDEVKKYLGDNYINSEYFLIHSGYIMHDGKYAAGMVANNSIMSLAAINGQVHQSTPRHEVFHVVLRNFVRPEIKQQLFNAVRIISKREGYKNIAGNEEEWMANDFSKNGQERNIRDYGALSNENDITLWEKFKTFIRGLVDRLMGVYSANKKLVDQYTKINNGEYVNKTEILTTKNNSDTAYEDVVDGERVDIKTNVGVRVEDSMEQAMKIKSTLDGKMKSTQSMLVAQRNIQLSLVQNTNYGNRLSSVGKTFNDSVNTLMNSRERMMNRYGDKLASIDRNNGKETMKISDIVNQGLVSYIVTDNSTANRMNAKSFADLYLIYSKPEYISALVQIALPRFDILNGLFDESFAVNEQYDWSHISSDDYVNSIQRLYLSSIPRIDALGTSVSSSLVLNYGIVSSIMKKIGPEARINAKNNGVDFFTSLKKTMQYYIDNGALNIEYNEDDTIKSARFLDEFTETIHSIYNYMFQSYSHPSLSSEFELNYGSIDGKFDSEEDFIGLEQKVDMIRNNTLANKMNGYTKQQMVDTHNDAQQFLLGMVGLYTSFYTKEQVKHVYANGSMRSIHYQNQSWKETSRMLQNSQMYNIDNGVLNHGIKHYMTHNISMFDNGNSIGIKTNIYDIDRPIVMQFQNERYMLVNDAGVIDTRLKNNIDKAEYVKANFKNFIDAYENSHVKLGMGSVSTELMKQIISSNSWNDVTGAMTRINNVIGNFMDTLKTNYSTPADWFVDYYGSMIKLYSIYDGEYWQAEYEGEAVKKKYHDVVEEVRQLSGSTLDEKISQIDGAKVVMDFIERTTPTGAIKYSFTDSITAIEDNDKGLDPEAARFITPNDMWVSSDLLASIMEKFQQKTDDKMLTNAEGTKSFNTMTTSHLMEAVETHQAKVMAEIKAMDMAYVPEDTNIIGIEESLGLSRDMGFISTGRNKIDAVDFIATSVEQFMHEMWRSIENPVIYVPSIPASDTGKIVYIKAKSNVITTKGNSFGIDYKVVASEMLREHAKLIKRITDSRNNLKNVIEQLNAVGINFEGEPVEKIKKEAYYNYKSLREKFIQASLEAHANGTFKEFKRIIDNSPLIKDLSEKEMEDGDLSLSKFDIGYQYIMGTNEAGEQVKMKIAIPGKYLFGKFSGYDMFTDKKVTCTDVKGNKTTLPIIEMIKAIYDNPTQFANANEELETLITRMFKDDYKRFAKQLSDYGFEASATIKDLNRRMDLNHKIFDDAAKTVQNVDLYYFEKGQKFMAQQPMFAYYLMTIIANNHLNDVTVDNLSMSDFFTTVKRNGAIHTPGINFIVDAKNEDGTYKGTVPAKTRMAYYYDIFTDGGMVYNKEGKLVPAEPIETENGQHYVMPLFQRFVKMSIGGDANTIMGNASAYKAVNNAKRSDGTFSQNKRADKIITGFDMQSKAYRNMFVRMMVDSDRAIARTGLFQSQTLLMDKFNELYGSFDSDKNDIRSFDDVMDEMYNWIVSMQYKNAKPSKTGIAQYKAIVDNLVGYMGSTSVQKGAVTIVNDYDHYNDDLSIELGYDEVDNTNTKMVMNPSQKSDTDKLQSFPSQQEAFFGVTDSIDIKKLNTKMMNSKADLQNALRQQYFNDISHELDKEGNKIPKKRRFNETDWTNIDIEEVYRTNDTEKILAIESGIEQLKSYIRKNIIRDLSQSNEDLAYIKLFQDDTISMNLPMMRQKFVQKSLNQINKVIQARTTGLRVTQVSGEYIELFKKDGRIYTYNDALNEIYGDYREFSFEHYHSDETMNELLSNGFTLEKINDMSIDEKGNTQHGTVVMSNIFADKYGHNKNESMIDIMTYTINDERFDIIDNRGKQGFISHILDNNPEFIDDSIEYIQSLSKQPQIRKAISNLNIAKDARNEIGWYKEGKYSEADLNKDWTKLYKETDRQYKDGDIGKTGLLKGITGMMVLQELLNDNVDLDKVTDQELIELSLSINDDQLSMVLDEAWEITNDLNNSWIQLLSRVPATFMGSGGIYKTVAFHNDGNVVYIPVGMIVRNDADFDIDALTDYANSIDDKGHKVSEGAGAIRNIMNDDRIKLFMHKDNQKSLFLSSSIKDIKDIPKEKKRQQKKEAESYINNSPVSINEAYKRNKAGADAIGILANSLSAISYILSFKDNINFNGNLKKIITENTPKGKLTVGMDSLITKLGSWLQGALDNAKNNTLGDYNVTELTVNILAVLKMNNMNNEDIYDMFNNYHVQQLFKDYSKRSSILTKSSDFDLYTMSVLKLEELENSVSKYSKKNYYELVGEEVGKKALDYNGGIDLKKRTENEMNNVLTSFKSSLIPLLESFYKPKQQQEALYFAKGSNASEEVDRWMADNNFTIESITENNKSILDAESTWLSDKLGGAVNHGNAEVLDFLKKHIQAIAELGRINRLGEGLQFISKLPETVITAEALYRLSSILKLRNGLDVMDNNYIRNKMNIELSLGMSLKDFNKLKKDPMSKFDNMDSETHIAYFKANNDVYNSLDQYDEKQSEQRRVLEEKERLIINEMNLPLFVKSIPQLNYVLQEYQRQSNLKQQMFIVDKQILKNLSKEFLATQQRVNFKYDNEHSVFAGMVNNLVLDYYYHNTGTSENQVRKPILPTLTNVGWQNGSVMLDMKNIFAREEFVTGFGAYVMDIVAHKSDLNYLKSLLTKGANISDDVLNKMQDNPFLDALVIRGKNKELAVNFSNKSASEVFIAKMRDYFNELPLEIRNMFINYEIIKNQLNYSKGTIMEIIGIDFYKGNISKAFNDINDSLNRLNSMEAFTSDNANSDFDGDVKQRIFDYLGANQNFAKYVALPFDTTVVNKPTYVWNTGLDSAKESKRIVYYKLNEAGGYSEMYKMTNAISLSPEVNSTSPVPVFKINVDQALQLETTGSTTIPGQHTLFKIESGMYRKTNTGLLVRVTNVSPNSYTIVKANNEVDGLMKQIKNTDTRLNDRISLVPESLPFNLLSPEVELNIKGNHPILAGITIKTINEKGQKVSLKPFSSTKVYKSINDILFALKEANVMSVSTKIDYFKKSKKLDGMTPEEYKSYIETIAKNLIGDAFLMYSDHYSAQELEVMRKQAAVAAANIAFNSMEIVSAIIKNNLETYTKKNDDRLEEVRMMMGPNTKLNEELEDTNIGIDTYANLVRQTLKGYFNNLTSTERMKNAENMAQLNTFETSQELFSSNVQELNKIYGIKVKKVNNILTDDLLTSIDALQNEISIEPNGHFYIHGDKNYMRGSNAVAYMYDLMMGKQKYNEKRILDYRIPKFKNDAERLSYEKNKISEERNFAIGSEVDIMARKFFSEWSKQINEGKRPVIGLPQGKLIDSGSLRVVLQVYAEKIDSYARQNGFDYEFLTQDAIVYDNTKSEMFDAYLGQFEDKGFRGEDGKLLPISGVATAHDLIVRFRLKGTEQYYDVMLDFKTIRSTTDAKKVLHTDISLPIGKDNHDASYRQLVNTKWKLQTELNRRLFNKTHNANITETGIIGLVKVESGNTIKFVIPSNVLESMKDGKNKPWYDVTLGKNDVEIKKQINRFTSQVANQAVTITNNESDNSESKNQC